MMQQPTKAKHRKPRPAIARWGPATGLISLATVAAILFGAAILGGQR